MREPTFHRRSLLAGGTATGLAWLAPSGAGAAPVTDARPPFATDIRLPGLLHAVVARPPILGVRLEYLDASSALRTRGVVGVMALRPSAGSALACLGGVAVLAHDGWSALKGRDALRLAWSDAPHDRDDHGDAPEFDGFVPKTAEPLMEPPSATVHVAAGSCTAWACLRAPETARAALAAQLGLAVEAVALHRTAPACAPDRFTDPARLFEAAYLSRAMRGTPVSLVWTRADDLPFRNRPSLA